MGAWRTIRHRLEEAAGGVPVRYVGRPWRASTAEGYPTAHTLEQERIALAALDGLDALAWRRRRHSRRTSQGPCLRASASKLTTPRTVAAATRRSTASASMPQRARTAALQAPGLRFCASGDSAAKRVARKRDGCSGVRLATASMAYDQEDGMPVETHRSSRSVIQEHLELRRRNAALEHEMPLERYMPDDPFENHPLFKTEEQARIEDTMDGAQSIVDEPTSLDWPPPTPSSRRPLRSRTAAEALRARPIDAAPAMPEPRTAAEESVEASDESLWSRSRDFDWGD